MELSHNKVFISRDLHQDSVFRKTLEAKGLTVLGKSLVEFQSVGFHKLPETDWIFFYSPRAVHYFFKQVPHISGLNVKYAAIGPGTAKALTEIDIEVEFIGTGAPESTAECFLVIAKGEKVLFPQATNSRQSIQKILGPEIIAYSIIVYDNVPIKKISQSSAKVMVFTSPLNATTYLNAFDLLPGQQIVVIGQPTASACKEIGWEPYRSDAPNEPALAKAVLELIELGPDVQ